MFASVQELSNVTFAVALAFTSFRRCNQCLCHILYSSTYKKVVLDFGGPGVLQCNNAVEA